MAAETAEKKGREGDGRKRTGGERKRLRGELGKGTVMKLRAVGGAERKKKQQRKTVRKRDTASRKAESYGIPLKRTRLKTKGENREG